MTQVGIFFKGALPDVTKLPPSAERGDAYLVGGVTYAYMNGTWLQLGAQLNNFFQNNLCYSGVAVTLLSENDLESLFICPIDLSEEDLEFFKITYPEDYRTFEYLWKGADKVRVA